MFGNETDYLGTDSSIELERGMQMDPRVLHEKQFHDHAATPELRTSESSQVGDGKTEL